MHIDALDATAAELRELALSAGLNPVGTITAKKKHPDPKTYIGKGKVAEVLDYANVAGAHLILFDQELSPSQERNLEASLNRRVLGRTGLILHIFALRAKTHEGKLQVELAQLRHASTRLVRGWTHLDRQRGGSGRGQGSSMGVTGTGESQLESDQRMLGERIKHINQRLEKVRKQRYQGRKARKKADIRSVSLVGYTNGGKSTLFNALCKADVYAADQLFATLDPSLRQLRLPVLGKIILTDTVGFIRQLPHGLVDAFRATLEEVKEADLLLHVVDLSASDRPLHIQAVDAVLAEIGACNVKQLLVYNKLDLVNRSPRIERDKQGLPTGVWVSGLHGEGLDLLQIAIGELLSEQIIDTILSLSPQEGQVRAQLYNMGAVVAETIDTNGSINLHVRTEVTTLRRIGSKLNVDMDKLCSFTSASDSRRGASGL